LAGQHCMMGVREISASLVKPPYCEQAPSCPEPRAFTRGHLGDGDCRGRAPAPSGSCAEDV